ncbi:MAG TPA: DUF167 domain-containing protein [Geobacteraceae bacterium]|nr:DUF167 domain-containing protein [Geobacteraceae bacterium]
MKNNPEPNDFLITETDEGVTFSLHVQPKACRNEICGISGKELKVRLTSPPVDGAANKLCREFFAKLLRVAKSNIRITAGEKSRHKTISVRGTTKDAVLALLNKSSRSLE